MEFSSVTEYHKWLDSDDRILPINVDFGFLNIYKFSSQGYITDGVMKITDIYRSTNGNDFVMLIMKDGSKRYFQIDKLIAFVFYCQNMSIDLSLNQITVRHINGDNHDHRASNLDVHINKEQWMISTYPGILRNTYYISNFGRLKRAKDNFIYTPIKDERYGYMFYGVKQENGKYLHKFVHRLVAWEFLKDTRNDELDVNHINGIKTDNIPENLEWVDRKTNIRHAMYTELNNITGENSPKAKMTNKDAEIICRLLVKYNGDIQQVFDSLISKNKNISRWVIEQIKYKKKWNAVSDLYFRKNQFDNVQKHRSGSPVLSEENVHVICKALLENNMDIYMTFNQLYSRIHGLTQSQIYKIKSKSTWKNISSLYF